MVVWWWLVWGVWCCEVDVVEEGLVVVYFFEEFDGGVCKEF